MKNLTTIILLLLPLLGFTQVDLPITFEDTTNIDYELTDFGGNSSMIVVDPTDTTNLVAQSIRSASAETWAGTTMGDDGLATAIPFTALDKRIAVRVWSPEAGLPVRVKVENANDPTISVETEVTTTVAADWDTLVFNFSNQATGTAPLNIDNVYDKISIFFNFGATGAEAGEQTFYWDDVVFIGGGGSNKMQIDLPITFEDTATVDYALSDFGGNASLIVADPTDTSNLVVQAIRTANSVTFAGTAIGANGLANPIPFTQMDSRMSIRVWSPVADVPVRLKAENAAASGIFVEAEAKTTAAGEWETLVFNFSNSVGGNLNLNNTYDKLALFFNFGAEGSAVGEQTFYFDDILFIGGGGSSKMQIDLPITFEDTATVDYALSDFGGNATVIVADPTDTSNLVVQAIRTSNAVTFAGTIIGVNGLASPIPFTQMDTRMSIRVWSPAAGIPVRLKAENAANPGIFVETEINTTVAGEWETLVFNFGNSVGGSLNFSNTYDKLALFFNFGAEGSAVGEQTFYFDDILFVGGGGSDLMLPDLPISFEDTATVDYALVDFGGNVSMIVADPTDANNLVGQAIRTANAETFAGTTVGNNGLANPIPLTAEMTTMSVRVWSPEAGTPVRLKVENAGNPGISVETEAMTTLAGEWEILVFDFANESSGTAAFNPENVYDKVTIFFNFNAAGAAQKTYYWDDITFGILSNLEQVPFASAGIKVSPNPASDYINIELPSNISKNTPLSIFNINGKLVQSEILSNDISLIGLGNLKAGFYFLRIDNGKQQLIERIIIAK